MEDRIVKMRELPSIVGLECTAIKEGVEAGTFPGPVPLTDSQRPATGWLMSELQEWIEYRKTKRDQKS